MHYLWGLYLIPFLHQTTTGGGRLYNALRLYLIPFLHQTTTCQDCCPHGRGLYLIPFLHQTTTWTCPKASEIGCILFHFYIKPQLECFPLVGCIVVSYSISTSNHNPRIISPALKLLYLIPFLHQTTTLHRRTGQHAGCILFHFYIKPQLLLFLCLSFSCCILFHFYIKPQLMRLVLLILKVVSYSISTSNHNRRMFLYLHRSVVSYSISTSNHNFG